MSALVTATSLGFIASNLFPNVSWSLVALISFIIFASFVGWGWHSAEKRIRELGREAVNRNLQEAKKKHLKRIEKLIINWINCLEIQPIHLVAKGIPSRTDVMKNEPLFPCLKKHLPSRNLWQNFFEWDSKANEYLKTCKELRSQIKESWKIEGTEPTEYFAEPILEMIAGDKKELQYRIDIIIDHTLEEVRYQKLVIDGTEVIRGLETLRGGYYKWNAPR